MIKACFSIIGGVIVVLGLILVVLAVTRKHPDAPVMGTTTKTEAVGSIGQTVTNGNWSVTLMDFGPWDRFAPGKTPSPAPQGKLLVADLRIANKHTATSNFTQSDFELKTGDGRSFKPAQWTASIDRGFVISQTVQPGLTTENRVVFNMDPRATGLTLVLLGTRWSVPVP
jgi:hypothetical protein